MAHPEDNVAADAGLPSVRILRGHLALSDRPGCGAGSTVAQHLAGDRTGSPLPDGDSDDMRSYLGRPLLPLRSLALHVEQIPERAETSYLSELFAE